MIEDDPGLQKQLRWSLDAYEWSSPATAKRRWRRSAATSRPSSPWTSACRPIPDGSTEGLATPAADPGAGAGHRVIVLTGNQDHGNAVKAIGMGAYDFHQKPCDPEVLNLVVSAPSSCTRCSRRTAACSRCRPIRRWPA
jgi:two-component system NtrC family response regulator